MIRLDSNRPKARFYRGGAKIAALRGESPAGSHEPEDWVGSVTSVFGEDEVGLTRLPEGRLLRDAIDADPVGWLGEEHVRRWGPDPLLLVKLLDAGQRLPVHAHPDDDFAARHLGHRHGKAEAWYILEGGTVHIGLKRSVAAEELARLVETQDAAALLALLHEVEVEPGDVVWVPPGELHAIGEGVFLLELQQPEDLSILLEWSGFALDGAAGGHLGLGFERALAAVRRTQRDARALADLVRRVPRADALLPPEADSFFRLERRDIVDETELDIGFAVAVVTEGDLVIGGAPAPRGSTFVIPYGDGRVTAEGSGALLIARPPRPSHADGHLRNP